MTIGGLQRLSLSDFPGRLSAIVFTRGCNFRCRYCHNPELVDPARYTDAIPPEEVLRYLSSRKGRLDGVVVTGGEPTQHEDLPDFLQHIQGLGMARKLDTNGSRPDVLREIMKAGLVDYVALDIKAPLGSYQRITRVGVDTSFILESLHLVMSCGIDYEVRTTYSPGFLSLDDLRELAIMIRGCRRFSLQAFRPPTTLDPGMADEPPPLPLQMEEARGIFESAGIPTTVR